jgi:hypothetical protein
VTRNRGPVHDPAASYGINRGHWHNWPDPERDPDVPAPLPARVDTAASYSIERTRR